MIMSGVITEMNTLRLNHNRSHLSVARKQKNTPELLLTAPGRDSLHIRNLTMIVITHDLGKYHTLKEAELVLSYLQFTKTAACWIKDKSAARITTQNVWRIYEQRKADLQKQGLSNKEYQDAIKRLADELGV